MRKVFGNLDKGLWIDLDDINLDPNSHFISCVLHQMQQDYRFDSFIKIHLKLFLKILPDIITEWKL